MIAAVNHALDGFVRPEVTILGAPRSAFQVCGFAGWIATALVALALAAVDPALEPWIAGLLVLAGSVTFLAVAVITKAITGTARLVFYHHAIAIGAAATGVIVALDVRPLPYLDLSAVALATFLMFGRVGCLMAGCCHGKPAHVGVRYRDEHVAAGFAHVLVGVRLFPSQALEAVLAFGLAAAGATEIATGAAPGSACTLIVLGYAGGRFLIELTRGDQFRPFFAGFSEAQWISLAATAAVIAGDLTEMLPHARWHAAFAAAHGFAACFVLAWRFLGHAPRHRLMHPGHIYDVALALDTLAAPGNRAAVVVATTSLGVRLSCSHHAAPTGAVEHVAISHRDGPMPEEFARIITDLVRLLRPPAARHEIITRDGIFHMLLHR
jgi:hypothetical protein